MMHTENEPSGDRTQQRLHSPTTTTPKQDRKVSPVSSDAAPKQDPFCEIFPVCMNIVPTLTIEDGVPTVTIYDGTKKLENYPLRNISSAGPKPENLLCAKDCTIKVKYTGTSLDIDLRENGFLAGLQRFIPYMEPINRDSWIAFDREIHDPNQITVVRPGKDNTEIVRF